METVHNYHAIKVDAKKCIGCIHCMKACPTEAIRIKKGIAAINAVRCVDCGNCLRACPVNAFYVEGDELSNIKSYKHRVILFPSVMIGQFPEKYTDIHIYQALLRLGFTHIVEVEQPIEWLLEMIKNQARSGKNRPLISSFCPAIVRLIQIKYPSLAGNVAKLTAPHDLALNYIIEELQKQGLERQETGIFYVSPCSAKLAAVKFPSSKRINKVDGIINMNTLYNQIMKVISSKVETETSSMRKYITLDGILWSLPRGEARHFRNRSMAIDGIHNVVKFLERLENNEVPELDFLELKSCDQGCAGGILLTGNRFLTVERMQKRSKLYPLAVKSKTNDNLKAIVQQRITTTPLVPQPAFSLDNDRQKAMEKLRKLDKILCQLPGIDCSGCGAPNCHALAEDMINNKAKMTSCVFLQKRYLRDEKTTINRIFNNLNNTWGVNRFEADCSKKGKRNEGF